MFSSSSFTCAFDSGTCSAASSIFPLIEVSCCPVLIILRTLRYELYRFGFVCRNEVISWSSWFLRSWFAMLKVVLMFRVATARCSFVICG